MKARLIGYVFALFMATPLFAKRIGAPRGAPSQPQVQQSKEQQIIQWLVEQAPWKPEFVNKAREIVRRLSAAGEQDLRNRYRQKIAALEGQEQSLSGSTAAQEVPTLTNEQAIQNVEQEIARVLNDSGAYPTYDVQIRALETPYEFLNMSEFDKEIVVQACQNLLPKIIAKKDSEQDQKKLEQQDYINREIAYLRSNFPQSGTLLQKYESYVKALEVFEFSQAQAYASEYIRAKMLLAVLKGASEEGKRAGEQGREAVMKKWSILRAFANKKKEAEMPSMPTTTTAATTATMNNPAQGPGMLQEGQVSGAYSPSSQQPFEVKVKPRVTPVVTTLAPTNLPTQTATTGQVTPTQVATTSKLEESALRFGWPEPNKAQLATPVITEPKETPTMETTTQVQPSTSPTAVQPIETTLLPEKPTKATWTIPITRASGTPVTTGPTPTTQSELVVTTPASETPEAIIVPTPQIMPSQEPTKAVAEPTTEATKVPTEPLQTTMGYWEFDPQGNKTIFHWQEEPQQQPQQERKLLPVINQPEEQKKIAVAEEPVKGVVESPKIVETPASQPQQPEQKVVTKKEKILETAKKYIPDTLFPALETKPIPENFGEIFNRSIAIAKNAGYRFGFVDNRAKGVIRYIFGKTPESIVTESIWYAAQQEDQPKLLFIKLNKDGDIIFLEPSSKNFDPMMITGVSTSLANPMLKIIGDDKRMTPEDGLKHLKSLFGDK